MKEAAMHVGSMIGSMVQQQVQLTVLRKALDMSASNAENIMRVLDPSSGVGGIVDAKA
jgi:hypothetical protein